MQLLEDFFRPILEDLLDAASKLVGHGAIDQTVIEGESEIADGPNGEFVTFTLIQVDEASDSHVPFLLHWPGQTRALREPSCRLRAQRRSYWRFWMESCERWSRRTCF